MKKVIAFLVALMLVMSLSASLAEPSGKVMLYSSMQEAQLQAIEQAFEAKYPTVDMEYYYAGGGKLVTKMTTEAKDGGQIASDVVWLGDPSDYESFKANGWLEPYVSPETEHIAKEYMDPEMAENEIAYPSAETLANSESFLYLPQETNQLMDSLWLEVKTGGGSKPTSKPGSNATAKPVSTSARGADKLISIAESKIGCPYSRGAKGPNKFDCSGFVYWCMKQAGFSGGYMTSITWRSCTRYPRINSMSQIQRGDILVFKGNSMDSGHVGIYLGGGKMIDASSGAGQVRITTSVLSGNYWKQHFLMAYRIYN